jgi:hypothetical protein
MPDGAILGFLDPIARGITTWGWDLAQAAIYHRYIVGCAVTAAVVPFARTARAAGRRVEWAAAAVLAGTWGQILLFSDLMVPGATLFAVAGAAAIVFGAANPLRPAAPPIALRVEIPVVAALTVLALVVRLYAIDQLPAFVDIEPAIAFFESLSGYGLAHYITHNRVEDDGFAHMLMRAAVQSFSGPSVIGIRLAGVVSGTLAVPLCYALVRRLAGVFPAALAGVLLLTAPEQLIFSRIEATQIGTVALAPLATAHLVLWLVRDWSRAAAVATAAWMPFSRFFYAPAIVLFLLPIATVLHALLLGPRRRATARALAIVAGGAALWLAASPTLHYVAAGEWGEASSLRVYGSFAFRPFNTQPGELDQEGAIPALRFQLARLAVNTGDLVRQFAYDRGAYSAWYLREHPDEMHRRSLHAALLIPLVAGLGYLLGRWHDSRAALLLLWSFLGVLPAVMSDEVEPRRLTVFYPAVPVIIGLFLDAVLRAMHTAAPRRATWPIRAALSAVALYVAITSLAANYRVHRGRLQYTEYVEFSRPYFETSDVIFHNVPDDNTILILAFGNATAFRQRLPGFHLVRDWDAEWTQVTDAIGCPFDHPVFSALLSRSAIDARCADFHPARITYLLRVETDEENAVARRLQERFPQAVIREVTGHDKDDPIRHMVGLTVAR